MTDTTVTYEREMTMTYGEEAMSSTKRSRMNTLLYQEGLCMVGDYAYRQNTDPKRFGNEEISSTKISTVITVDGSRTAVETDRDKIAGWISCLNGLGFTANHQNNDDLRTFDNETTSTRVAFEKTKAESTRTVEQQPQGAYLICGGEFSGNPMFDNIGYRPDGFTLAVVGDDDERHTFIRATLSIGAYGPPTLSFKMWYDADSIENKTVIEQRLVIDPLSLMGQIQATVERCMAFLGVNTEDPVVDCEFKCLNESKSECAPDIIAMVRAEKQKHL